MPDFLGFQYRAILDLYRILFHAVVIFGPEHDFLFKSVTASLQNSLPFDAFGIQHPDFGFDSIFEQGDKTLLDSSFLFRISGQQLTCLVLQYWLLILFSPFFR